MQYEAWKFITLFPKNLTKLQANEVPVTFDFKP